MKFLALYLCLAAILGYTYGQINDSPTLEKQSIQNPQDLGKDVQNHKHDQKRSSGKGEDIGGSHGSQSSGSAIGATQLGQKDLLNQNERKHRQIDPSKVTSSLQNEGAVDKLMEKSTKQHRGEIRKKRQELLGTYNVKNVILNDIILPYRKKREFLSNYNLYRSNSGLFKRSPTDLTKSDQDENREAERIVTEAMVPTGGPTKRSLVKRSETDLTKTTQDEERDIERIVHGPTLGAMVPMGVPAKRDIESEFHRSYIGPTKRASDLSKTITEEEREAERIEGPLFSALVPLPINVPSKRDTESEFGSLSEVSMEKGVSRPIADIESSHNLGYFSKVGRAAITHNRLPKEYLISQDS